MSQPNFLLATFPAQGHLNPALQLAKRLLRLGAKVTVAMTVHASRRMADASFPDGLSLSTYSDGFDDGFKPGCGDPCLYFSEMRRCGSQTLSNVIQGSANEGKPFNCVVVSVLLNWAAEVARQHSLPTALLWVQPATVFDIYYYYFNGYDDVVANCNNDPTYVLKLPGLPLQFNGRELPSLLNPANPYSFSLPEFKEQMDGLNKEAQPKVLVNTFDSLEAEALKAVEKFHLIAIGPLVPSAFLDGDDLSDTTFGCDLIKGSFPKEQYIEWLNSKPKSSVVYASFGTIFDLSDQQTQEMARGLLGSGYPFLLVIRKKEKQQEDGKERQAKEGDQVEDDPLKGYRKELEQQGMIVPWCSQVEVLSHPAVGCFLTHCGWNSTLESLVSGVPVVAFPQGSDQGTNAKLIEELWETGVRVNANADEGIVDGDEIRRCLDLVMQSGEKEEEMRTNARKFKDLARDAMKEGGSSYQNLKTFVDNVREAA